MCFSLSFGGTTSSCVKTSSKKGRTVNRGDRPLTLPVTLGRFTYRTEKLGRTGNRAPSGWIERTAQGSGPASSPLALCWRDRTNARSGGPARGLEVPFRSGRPSNGHRPPSTPGGVPPRGSPLLLRAPPLPDLPKASLAPPVAPQQRAPRRLLRLLTTHVESLNSLESTSPIVDTAIAEVVPTKGTAEGRGAGTCAPLQFDQNKEARATWAAEPTGNPAFGRG